MQISNYHSFDLQKTMMERKTVLLNNGVSRCLTHNSVTANDGNNPRFMSINLTYRVAGKIKSST